MADIEELQKNTAFTVAGRSGSRSCTFLPEPERRSRRWPIISVDDHIVEPRHAFDGRYPAEFVDRAPRVVEAEDGSEAWLYDGQVLPNVGFNAVVGRPVSEYSFEPTRFDQMRRGAWDIHHRVRDMDLAGIWASMNFPSFLPGFAGQRLQLIVDDPKLALASVRAWNDFDASRVVRGVVQGGPDLEAGRAVDSPEGPIVLMPWQGHAGSSCLVPEHGAIEDDLFAENGSGDSAKQVVFDPRRKERIEFERLELAIAK